MSMLGASCSPCCDQCGGGKPYVDPDDTASWVPSGQWQDEPTGVTWSLDNATPSEAWFFYGSAQTSKPSGNAALNEQRAWDNLCNWYSVKTTAPSDSLNAGTTLVARATRLPPESATIHVYSQLNPVSERVVRRAYIWNARVLGGALTLTEAAHNTSHGAVLTGSENLSQINGGALFLSFSLNGSTVNDGATFTQSANAYSVFSAGVYHDYVFVDAQEPGGAVVVLDGGNTFVAGIVNGGAEFIRASRNGNAAMISRPFSESGNLGAKVFGGAVFDRGSSNIGLVYGGAEFLRGSVNEGSAKFPYSFGAGAVHFRQGYASTVSGGAVFGSATEPVDIFNFASNRGVVNDGAVFHGTAENSIDGLVNGGAVFNGSTRNKYSNPPTGPNRPYWGVVFDGATFNDDACSELRIIATLSPTQTFKFVANARPWETPVAFDEPQCNGSALPASLELSCGCG